jgi:uncharacterized protein (DUF2236 family)
VRIPVTSSPATRLLVRAGLLGPRLLVGPGQHWMQRRFRARVSGDPSGAPDWVRDVATVGDGAGWFEPDGVVWRVHGDLSTLAGGVAALLGQACHPLAVAGVEGHSAYREDPWKRLAGTARWLVLVTFGSAELAERESARVRGMHRRVVGTAADGRAYAASSPALLRWVHLAFTDAFLHGQLAVGDDLARRYGRRWPDAYVADWARSARELGATDLPSTEAELTDAIAAEAPTLGPVPAGLRSFLLGPPGLEVAERAFYATLVRAGSLLLHPALADYAAVPGRGRQRARGRAELVGVRTELVGMHLLLGRYSPSEAAARYRLGLGPRPDWL